MGAGFGVVPSTSICQLWQSSQMLALSTERPLALRTPALSGSRTTLAAPTPSGWPLWQVTHSWPILPTVSAAGVKSPARSGRPWSAGNPRRCGTCSSLRRRCSCRTGCSSRCPCRKPGTPWHPGRLAVRARTVGVRRGGPLVVVVVAALGVVPVREHPVGGRAGHELSLGRDLGVGLPAADTVDVDEGAHLQVGGIAVDAHRTGDVGVAAVALAADLGLTEDRKVAGDDHAGVGVAVDVVGLTGAVALLALDAETRRRDAGVRHEVVDGLALVTRPLLGRREGRLLWWLRGSARPWPSSSRWPAARCCPAGGTADSCRTRRRGPWSAPLLRRSTLPPGSRRGPRRCSRASRSDSSSP